MRIECRLPIEEYSHSAVLPATEPGWTVDASVSASSWLPVGKASEASYRANWFNGDHEPREAAAAGLRIPTDRTGCLPLAQCSGWPNSLHLFFAQKNDAKSHFDRGLRLYLSNQGQESPMSM